MHGVHHLRAKPDCVYIKRSNGGNISVEDYCARIKLVNVMSYLAQSKENVLVKVRNGKKGIKRKKKGEK